MVSDTTIIPSLDGGDDVELESSYTLRDDGQPRFVDQPSGPNGENGYRLEYTYNQNTGAPQRLVEVATGDVIVSDVDWNQAGQVVRHNYGTGANDARATWTYDPQSLRLTEERFGTNANPSSDRRNVYAYDGNSVSYTHLTLPTNREV